MSLWLGLRYIILTFCFAIHTEEESEKRIKDAY